MDECTHNQFDTLSPTTVTEFAETFTAETLTGLHHDVAHLATGDGPIAAAWRIIVATLEHAQEERFFIEHPERIGRRDRP